jgi:hypothetical protein
MRGETLRQIDGSRPARSFIGIPCTTGRLSPVPTGRHIVLICVRPERCRRPEGRADRRLGERGHVFAVRAIAPTAIPKLA